MCHEGNHCFHLYNFYSQLSIIHSIIYGLNLTRSNDEKYVLSGYRDIPCKHTNNDVVKIDINFQFLGDSGMTNPSIKQKLKN